jgi:hypothetical protein
MDKLERLGLFDEFVMRGRWYLPQESWSDAVPGELNFSTSGIQLKLDEMFKTHATASAFERMLRLDIPKTPTIWGTTVAGEKITLRRAFFSSVGEECEIVANEVIVGAHVDDDVPGSVQSAEIELTHLDEWAYVQQFRMEESDDKNRTRLSYPVEPLEVLRVNDAHPFKKLAISASVRGQFRRTDIQLKAHTELIAEFATPQSITSARTTLDYLIGLLSLLVGESVYPKRIHLTMRTDSEHQTIGMFMSLRRRSRRLEYAHQMTFPLAQIHNEVPSIIRGWFAQEEKLRPVYNLVLSTVQAPDQYVQSTFLSLAQALESFHRIVYGGEYENGDTYDQVRRALAAAIPAGISPALTTKLHTMLKYGNQFSLRDRLRELFDVLGLGLMSDFLGNEKPTDFISKMVDIRNHLTHHDVSSSHSIVELAGSTIEMHNLNQRLRALVTALLLKNIGMPDEPLGNLFLPQYLHLAH